MLLSDIIKELEAKGQTSITANTDKWGNIYFYSVGKNANEHGEKEYFKYNLEQNGQVLQQLSSALMA